MQPVEFDRVNVIFKGNSPDVGDLPAFYDNKENVNGLVGSYRMKI